MKDETDGFVLRRLGSMTHDVKAGIVRISFDSRSKLVLLIDESKTPVLNNDEYYHPHRP